MTFKRVLLVVLSLTFAPEIMAMIRWAFPVGLGVASSGAINSLAKSLIGVLVTAGLIYAMVLGAGVLWRRCGPWFQAHLERQRERGD